MVIKSICDWGAFKNIEDEYFSSINLKDRLQAYAANNTYKALSVLIKSQYKVFKTSLYEQIRTFLLEKEILDARIINKFLLYDLLDKAVTPKKYIKSEICDFFIKELIQDDIIEKTNNDGIYKVIIRAKD